MIAGANLHIVKLVRLAVVSDDALQLVFSDGAAAVWCVADLIERSTVMTRSLADPAYFARATIESGTLAWPNGLELSAHALHLGLTEAGVLWQPTA